MIDVGSDDSLSDKARGIEEWLRVMVLRAFEQVVYSMDDDAALRQLGMVGRDVLSAIAILEHALPPPMSLGGFLTDLASLSDLFLTG